MAFTEEVWCLKKRETLCRIVRALIVQFIPSLTRYTKLSPHPSKPFPSHTTPHQEKKKTVGKGLLHHPILPSHENNPSRFQHLSTSFPPHLLPPTPRVTRLPGLLPHLKTRPPPRPPPQPQMLIRRTRGIEIQSLHPAITPPETDIIEPTDRESVPAVLIPSPRVRGTRVVG